MARIISITGRDSRRLAHGWELASTAAGAVSEPAQMDDVGPWFPATVPGTVAAALSAAGRWRVAEPAPLHDQDHWYRLRFDGQGRQTLRLGGLATLAQVWLDGKLILQSDNMFLSHEVQVDLTGDHYLHLCFRSLAVRLKSPGKRARWRPQMMTPASLRGVRTTLLGHMPGWCPPVHAVGPWRAIELLAPLTATMPCAADVRAQLHHDDSSGNDVGVLRVELSFDRPIDPAVQAVLECADCSVPMQLSQSGNLVGELVIDPVRAWWPHTHGEPHLYEVRVRLGQTLIDLGRTGFRRIEIDRGDEGRDFAIKVNGTRIFCRGAVWTSADLVALPDSRAAYEPWLQRMREANMNMVRVGGTMVYEADAFHELCDELGILVWQDFMFANFDYPVTDPDFERSVRLEAQQLLDRTQSSPSLVVLCGGSEVAQQASMLGLASATWTGPLFDRWLPDVVQALRPDCHYVRNSPDGGDCPFFANAGVSHYYGVGAYLYPLEDARRAQVRFASECLAFANMQEAIPWTVTEESPMQRASWKLPSPRTHWTLWDFEDIRDHYLAQLYGLEPARLRREDPQWYLELSRATTGEVMETVFAEWRRHRSVTTGGLIWFYQDLGPGHGWGVVDSRGERKPCWYALRRAFQPLQVALTDEGVNGLAVHLINDTARDRRVSLSLACVSDVAVVAAATAQTLVLGPRSTQEYSAATLLGSFFDFTQAYAFGPSAHRATVVTLTDTDSGELLAQAFHFPRRREVRPQRMQLTTKLELCDGEWFLVLKSDHLALSVHIEDGQFRPEDNWFHLAPNMERRLRLLPRTAVASSPDGEVRALNAQCAGRYRAIS